MSKILNRDEFAIELTKYRTGNEVNEGLFQFLKSFFKEDWKDIKSKSSELKNRMEDIDKSLDGFTILKRSNFDACTQFRQALCDFANDLLESKLDELEHGKALKKVVMGIGSKEDNAKNEIEQSPELTDIVGPNSIKSEALRDKLQDSAEAVSDVIKKYPAIETWANALKRGVKNLINDIIVAKSDSDDKENIKKIVDKKKAEDEKWLSEHNKEGLKSQQQKIDEITKERQKTLSAMNVSLLQAKDGNKAIDSMIGEFANIAKPISDVFLKGLTEGVVFDSQDILNEAKKVNLADKVKEAIGNDKSFGIESLINKLGDKYDEDSDPTKEDIIRLYFRYMYYLLSTVMKGLYKKFGEVPSDAIQGMIIGFSYAIMYGLTGDKVFESKDVLTLMARCSIAKDATVGYSLPYIDEKNTKSGTIFASILTNMKNGSYKEVFEVKNKKGSIDDKYKKISSQYQKNIGHLMNDILKAAQKINENAEKQRQKEADALKKRDEAEEKTED